MNCEDVVKIKARLLQIDLLKLFAIALVIWGHCIQYFSYNFYSEEPVYRIIYSFHMPLFMMISGFFSVSSMKMGFRAFFLKKSSNFYCRVCRGLLFIIC